MLPSALTEDYYAILEVHRDAGPELIVKSYRRLARKLHPDRNTRPDATQAFQQLGRAYETLNDEGKRREYDLSYFRSKRKANAQCNSAFASTEAVLARLSAQIEALLRLKQERAAQWTVTNRTLDSSISELKKEIKQLEQEIACLHSIRLAEAAEDASRNSWVTWLLSPLYKKAEETEEMKAQKDRARQERSVEKVYKEGKLRLKTDALKSAEHLLTSSKAKFVAANLQDDQNIWQLQDAIFAQQRQQRERQERERQACERAEQNKRAEQLRQEQRRRDAAAQEAIEEVLRAAAARQRDFTEARRQHASHSTYTPFSCSNFTTSTSTSTSTSTCTHAGWWPKVDGRANCPSCAASWTYLLRCPGCAMQACPRCQAAVRPRQQRFGRERSEVPQAARAQSPGYEWW